MKSAPASRHEVRRRSCSLSRLAVLLGAVLPVAVLFSSCGGPAPKAAASSAPAEAPAEGTIMYHEPVPQQGITSRKTTPVTQIFTTAEGELAEDNSFQTFSGTIEGVERGQSISEKQMQAAIERMMRMTKAGSTRVLRPEKFKELWQRVEKAGLFRLPLYRGEGRPETEPYFFVKSGERTWIFERPHVVAQKEDDPAIPHIKVWNGVKIVFFDFVNER